MSAEQRVTQDHPSADLRLSHDAMLISRLISR